MYRLLRPLLFRMDPERAHDLAIRWLERLNRSPRALRWVGRQMRVEDPRLATKLWGLAFPTPVGLAAGFDKNARVPLAMAAVGFGFVEVGTVTSQAQEGNPKPRIFRLPEHRALINRLGFNNEGKDAVAARLARTERPDVPLGVNVGKARAVELDQATEDYLATFEALEPYADYAVVNVSSPNTPGLRDLQGRDALRRLLNSLHERRRQLARARGAEPVPLLLKIAPDLDDRQLDEVLQVAHAERVNGVIAVNTTTARPVEHRHAGQSGGLSGAPLAPRALEVVRRAHRTLGEGVPVVGVGGVFDGDDAYAMIRAGASLVQIYTGFIYGGPSTARYAARQLSARLEQDGFAHVSEAVGVDSREGPGTPPDRPAREAADALK